jgi:hypothetical protein
MARVAGMLWLPLVAVLNGLTTENRGRTRINAWFRGGLGERIRPKQGIFTVNDIYFSSPP